MESADHQVFVHDGVGKTQCHTTIDPVPVGRSNHWELHQSAHCNPRSNRTKVDQGHGVLHLVIQNCKTIFDIVETSLQLEKVGRMPLQRVARKPP